MNNKLENWLAGLKCKESRGNVTKTFTRKAIKIAENLEL